VTELLPTQFTPVRDGYTFQPSYPVLETNIGGGLSRKRQGILYAPHIVNVNWVLTSTQYTQFMGFFRTTLQNATQAFLTELVTDIALPTLHKCRTLGGMPKLTQQKGLAFFVACTLEVEVNPTYTGYINYDATPGFISYTDAVNPTLVGPIRTGDFVRVVDSSGLHPDGDVAINVDGVYEVTSTTGDSILNLTSPELVNSDWTVIAGLSPSNYGSEFVGAVTSTVTRVPT
jgi:hypothetical protein